MIEVNSLKTICEGCGAKIQTIDPLKVGYIKSEVYLKNPDDFLCERCFNLRHYNKEVDIFIDEENFNKNIKIISKSKGLVVYVIDAFDIEGTLFDNLNEMFPQNKIIIIANKFDLFLSSTKKNKIRTYLLNYLQERNIRFDKLLICSSKNDKDITSIINTIDKVLENNLRINDIYLFGVTNVGKSTLLNKILKEIKGTNEKITVSNIPGTTLDLVKIGLDNKLFIYDTPGIINKYQFTYYLDKESLNVTIPRKFIKPKIFQVYSSQTILIGNFAALTIKEGSVSVVVTVSNEIPIHRTKADNYSDFILNHSIDILKYPNEEEIKRLGQRKETIFNITNKEEIVFCGLGNVSIVGNCIVSVNSFEKIKILKRAALI